MKYVKYAVGNEVLFGTYEQDGDIDNGVEDIEWIVLDLEGDKALLLSKYSLEMKEYDEELENNTWEKSTIRSWLNSNFIEEAFTAEEQAAILKTEVDNSQEEGCSKDGTNGGNNTEDQVFLLSYKEAFEDYFTRDKERICIPTAYTLQQGADEYVTDNGACDWWLRSPGPLRSPFPYGTNVSERGSLGSWNIGSGGICVRPALWINLESDIF